MKNFMLLLFLFLSISFCACEKNITIEYNSKDPKNIDYYKCIFRAPPTEEGIWVMSSHKCNCEDYYRNLNDYIENNPDLKLDHNIYYGNKAEPFYLNGAAHPSCDDASLLKENIITPAPIGSVSTSASYKSLPKPKLETKIIEKVYVDKNVFEAGPGFKHFVYGFIIGISIISICCFIFLLRTLRRLERNFNLLDSFYDRLLSTRNAVYSIRDRLDNININRINNVDIVIVNKKLDRVIDDLEVLNTKKEVEEVLSKINE